jgi:hypothetical protein
MHKDQLRCIFLDQMLLFEQCVKIIQRYSDPFFSESFRYRFEHLLSCNFREIQNCPFCSGIQVFLHIFFSADIPACNHRNTDKPVDLPHQIDRLFMIFIRCGQVEHDQFVRPALGIMFCERHYVSCYHTPVVKPFHRFSTIDQNTGCQSFITHFLPFSLCFFYPDKLRFF